jgi:hypothetical protein
MNWMSLVSSNLRPSNVGSSNNPNLSHECSYLLKNIRFIMRFYLKVKAITHVSLGRDVEGYDLRI